MSPRPSLLTTLLALALLCACAAPTGRRPRVVPPDHDGPFTTWWNDTVVKEQGTYKAGKRDGDIQVYFVSGERQSSGHFVAGKPEGVLTTWNEKGLIASKEPYRDGLLDGSRERFGATTGERIERCDFSKGMKNGLEEQHKEGGQPILRGSWRDDLPVGLWQHWDPVGRLALEQRYWVVAGEPVGRLETVLASDGEVRVQTLVTLRGDTWRGWQTTWHDNGRQAGLVEYDNGLRDGRDVSWDRTGQLVIEGTRVKDKRSGVWTFFGGRGEVARTVVYLDGEEVIDGAAGPPAGGSD